MIFKQETKHVFCLKIFVAFQWFCKKKKKKISVIIDPNPK